jgi:2-oxoacid:acceptor oxidoreductase gamma subunit (pyruvate/2-ketoisovalerate family)
MFDFSSPGSNEKYMPFALILGGERLIEIRFHGRGGQGAQIASRILAEAAFEEGYDVQAFPYFGVERRGAPVTAFTKLDKKPIRVRSQIYEPDYVVVLGDGLLSAQNVNVIAGLKPGGKVIVNTKRPIAEIKKKLGGVAVATVDATGIALNHGLGTKAAPIVNTSILGSIVKASGLVKLELVLNAIRSSVPSKKEENASAAKEAYEKTQEA